MSSVHNDLAGWAQKARLRGHKTIEIDVDTADRAAEQIVSQAIEIERLRNVIREAITSLEGTPEYHYTGMGCGLEDRGITDRYDAMHHGWECAMERVYGENIAWAKDALASAISPSPFIQLVAEGG